MALARVQNIFNARSGLPTDGIVNTWHFERTGDFVAVADATALADIVSNFYHSANAPGVNLMTLTAGKSLAALLWQTTKIYDISGGLSGPPVFVKQYGPAGFSNNLDPFPAEVCCALSFRGSMVGVTANRGRRRGRIYFGPLANTEGVMATDAATGQAVVHNTLRTSLVNAAKGMRAAALTAGWTWVVYSKTERASGTADGTTVVTTASVDNVFDTQRRRGQRASDRMELSVL